MESINVLHVNEPGMKIEHTEAENKGRFDAIRNEVKAGTMTYNWIDQTTIGIDHTEVFSGFKGDGVGKKLVYEAVEFARRENLKIIPHCSYAKHILQGDKAFSDVLILSFPK